MVEDREDDAILILNELKYSGKHTIAHWERVDTLQGIEAALKSQTWDIILSDYNLSGFNALDALDIVHRLAVEVPFILISGAIGEETAVIALKAGVHDYLLKDRLSRLPLAVSNELKKAQARQELKRAQDELQTAKDFAELANKRKSQVLAYVAHEFKNPLHAIKLHADLLQKSSSRNPLTEHQTVLINNIMLAASQLTELSNDLLDTAAIEADKIVIRSAPVHLNHVIDNVLVVLNPAARARNTRINVSGAEAIPALSSDAKRLQQIIINLTSNAIKYSPKNSLVNIRC